MKKSLTNPSELVRPVFCHLQGKLLHLLAVDQHRSSSAAAFVFELGQDAFMLLDVLPRSQIHGLIQGIALAEGIQVT